MSEKSSSLVKFQNQFLESRGCKPRDGVSIARIKVPKPVEIATELPYTHLEDAVALHASASVSSTQVDLDGPGYIRLPQVLAVLGISRSGFYQGIKDGLYKRPTKLGLGENTRAVGWTKSYVKELLRQLDEA
ncbi:MAG: AlpA family phage regulatory protein [Burkholderiaceae bacterium]|nr:AlpA family phage regulatory protein [Burkholderiaceae bacterium]